MELWDRRKYLQDVKFLKEIIINFEVKGDFKGIDDIIESIQNNEKNLVDYRLNEFTFHLKGAIAGAKPADQNFCKVNLENRFALKDNLKDDFDPLFKYSLDLKITLYKSERDQKLEHSCTWHLDKEDRVLDFSYQHPYYHIQFGGKNYDYLDNEMAILSSPRIPHPPMDIILAFHFILNNFVDRKLYPYVDKILRDFTYCQILKNSIDRLWKPYFQSLGIGHNHQEYSIEKLFPLYRD